MTEPFDRFQRHAAVLRELMDQAGDLTVYAAERADADNFGIDARISTAHKFVDLEVKGHVKLLENLIGGPWVGPVSIEPLPSEPITVEAAGYPRKIEPDGDFTRVGIRGFILPASAIRFLPAVLPANATEFRIALKDYRYIGSNYRGKVKLTGTSTSTGTEVRVESVFVAGL